MTPLKLQHLDIAGFKSFVDPVELAFAGGLTAIVGPNGCGKSNISDAITWVLGEQSAKKLRGGTMEDVIFAGAEGRKALGMAEVTLRLETDPAFPHADDGRLSIGRRVFRTGESRYTINGRPVRLREIKDLLMDTGLGLRAYSVIEQGKVGMILSGKPQERRRLLEEAAGITRYKQRKRIAEVKLEEATGNLMRLDDVIGEVERSLRSLKRQASAARRFKKKQAEYRELLERVLAGRFAAARGRLAAVATDLAAAQDREAALAAAVARGETELAAARERLDELAADLSAHHRRHADLAATIEGRQQFLRASRERLGEIGERSKQSHALAERRRCELDEQRQRLDGLAGRRGELEAQMAAAERDVDRDAAEIGTADERLRDAERRVEETRQRLLAAIGELNALGDRRHQGQIELEKGNYRRHHLGEELSGKEGELAQTARAVEETALRVEDLEARLAEGGGELATVRATLEATMQREKEANREQRALAERRADAERRRKLLTELGRVFAEHRERLRQALDGIGAGGGVGFLADRLRSVEGWERSLDFYLAGLEHALVVAEPGAGGALDLARALAAGPGATVVEPLPAARQGAEAGGAASSSVLAAVDDPAVVLSLGEALGLPAPLAAALPPAFLVEEPADAARLARRHPGVAFISRPGIWAAGGAVHAEAGEAVPGVLERDRELGELATEMPRIASQEAEVAALLERLVERRAATAREANALEGSLDKLRQELAVAAARREDAAARHRRLGVERETVADEVAELDRELARLGGNHDQLAAELTAAERRHAAIEGEQEAAAADLEAARAERQQKKEASAEGRGRLDLLRERLEGHDRDIDRLTSEIATGERQVAEWENEASRLTGRRAGLEGEIETAERELQEALERRDESGDAVTAASERVETQRQTIRGLEARLADARERRDAARGEVEELRVRQAELRQAADHVAEAYRDEFLRPQPAPGAAAAGGEDDDDDESDADGDEAAVGAVAAVALPAAETVAEVAGESVPEAAVAATGAAEPLYEGATGEDDVATAAAGAEPDEAEIPLSRVAELLADAVVPTDLDALEREMARTRAALERLGPVNVLAVEEYAEQEERHAFLTEQRADVADSVASLRRTIREINQTSSERFLDTFARVNVAFGQVFQRLFRGGEAEMRLLDEDDVLESGIEIVARPPGKRLQNILLMSGGEKALTAIALLFALFQAKPSPFCILDEVDAPLDDVNTLRFVELLEEMAKETQFLIITHNKLTMEVAGTLYGVTMQEKGVSKLVAVELDDVQPRRQTA